MVHLSIENKSVGVRQRRLDNRTSFFVVSPIEVVGIAWLNQNNTVGKKTMTRRNLGNELGIFHRIVVLGGPSGASELGMRGSISA